MLMAFERANNCTNWSKLEEYWVSYGEFFKTDLKLENFAPTLCSHGRHAGKDLNITSLHICHIFKIMAFFKICTHDICHYFKCVWHFFQYAAWLYLGMSAMSANSCNTFWLLHFLILHNQLSIGLLLIKNSILNNNQIVWNNRRHIDRIYIWARNYDVNK